MRAQLIDRIIAMSVAAILLTLLAGSEAGLASNDLASGHDLRMGSAQVFTSAQSARIVIAGTQMAALNAVEEPFESLGLHFTDGPLAQIWQDFHKQTIKRQYSLSEAPSVEPSSQVRMAGAMSTP